MPRTAFVGTYTEHNTSIRVRVRRTCTGGRRYTHAIIPYYTTKKISVPNATYPHLMDRVDTPCEPWYGKPQFCGSLALAQKKLKPGWLLIEVQEDLR